MPRSSKFTFCSEGTSRSASPAIFQYAGDADCRNFPSQISSSRVSGRIPKSSTSCLMSFNMTSSGRTALEITNSFKRSRSPIRISSSHVRARNAACRTGLASIITANSASPTLSDPYSAAIASYSGRLRSSLPHAGTPPAHEFTNTVV